MRNWLIVCLVLVSFAGLALASAERIRDTRHDQTQNFIRINCEGINNVRLTIRTIITGAYSKPRPDLTEPERFEILGRLLKLVPDPLKC